MSKIDWLEKHGFDRYSEDTYVNIELDTYSIKEELKADGYKYDAVLGWHTAYPNKKYPHVRINFNDVCEWSNFEQTAKYYVDAKDKVEWERKKLLSTESRFEYFGEEGEKYTDIEAEFHSQKGFQGNYGWTYINTFYAADACLVWFTTTNLVAARPGDQVKLAFTVKGYEEYNGEETTLITRCKVEKI